MNNFHNTAFFVRHPFAIEDLRKPHPHKEEKPFAVVKTIGLSKIDYENFIRFIKDNQGIIRNKISETDCTYKIGFLNEKNILFLAASGSEDRKVKGKSSQVLHLICACFLNNYFNIVEMETII